MAAEDEKRKRNPEEEDAFTCTTSAKNNISKNDHGASTSQSRQQRTQDSTSTAEINSKTSILALAVDEVEVEDGVDAGLKRIKDGQSWSGTDIGYFAFPRSLLGDCSTTHFYDYLAEKEKTSGKNAGGYQRWFDPEDGGAGKKAAASNVKGKGKMKAKGKKSSSTSRDDSKGMGKKSSKKEAAY